MLLIDQLTASIAGGVPRNLFFTGKGGVGKTSVACATAIGLARRGNRVLLVSTDPASNLDEVLETALAVTPRPVQTVPGLFALNIDPVAVAAEYRERVVGPYRGLLPDAAVRSIEEQLSGACTVEIAAFDAFAKLLGNADATAEFAHVVFDTAPTGHTLRLLELPAAWTGYLESSAGDASCLGPLSGLTAQRDLYDLTRRALEDHERTRVVLVSRAESAALHEAARTKRELATLGIQRLSLVVNGIFHATDSHDPIARELERRCSAALQNMPSDLRELDAIQLPLLPFGLVGVRAVEALAAATPMSVEDRSEPRSSDPVAGIPLQDVVAELAAGERGVVMTMGKGGVGKTSVAVRVATELARLGHRVHLTTTDPAGHVEGSLAETVGATLPGLSVGRIDPHAVTRAYADDVLGRASATLDAAGRALLEEELRSPCTEEVAVFREFAKLVSKGEHGFVVIDTAPTGHTLLLLDAAESYHREVLRSSGAAPIEVRELLPKLRDANFTKVLLVTLPEATPVHEAAALQDDLQRAGITPFAWIINQSLLPLRVSDPLLVGRRQSQAHFHDEVAALAPRIAVVAWE